MGILLILEILGYFDRFSGFFFFSIIGNLEISGVFWSFYRFLGHFAHFRDFEDILVILVVVEYIW